jgi:hypothetical protein
VKFIYKPEGAKPREWPFDPAKLMSPEIEAIERHTGFTFQGWAEAIGNGSFIAIHGLLYVMLKREAPTLRWDDVQFSASEIDMVMEAAEKAALLYELQRRDDLSRAEQEVMDDLIAEGIEPKPLDAGKA